MIVASIDPGSSGAIAFFSIAGFLLGVEDMPVIQVKVGKTLRNRVSGALLAKLIRERRVDHAFVELVGDMPGQSGMFAFGKGCGIIEGVLETLAIPTTFVTPQVWKKSYGLGKDKGLARQKAIQLLPGAAGLFARVKDTDRSEAALLGLYGLRTYFPHQAGETAARVPAREAA